MKRILSFLLCIIFLKAQAFAIHGNLEGTDSGTILVGTYSGTLTPVGTESGTREIDFNTGETTDTLNSLGMFSVSLPEAGTGTGSFIIFTGGRSFAGTITAVGDPGTGTMTAILEASYDYVDFVYDANGNPLLVQDQTTGAITPVTQDYTASVRGTMEAQINASISAASTTAAATGNLGRIAGDARLARLYVDPAGGGGLVTDEIVNYKVDGVKQSFTVAASTLTAGGDTTGGDTAGLGNLLNLLF